MKRIFTFFALFLALSVCLAACADSPVGGQAADSRTEEARTGDGQTEPAATDAPVTKGAETESSTADGEQTGDTETDAVRTDSATEAPKGEAVLVSFSALDLDGNAVDQGVFGGNKLNVVNVWATFCGPCIREMPELGKISKAFADRGVGIVGVIVDVVDGDYRKMDGMVAEARDIVYQTGASYLHIIPSADMSSVCRVQYVPTTFFLDGEGYQVAEPIVGSRTEAEWTELIESILASLK